MTLDYLIGVIRTTVPMVTADARTAASVVLLAVADWHEDNASKARLLTCRDQADTLMVVADELRRIAGGQP